MHKTMSFKSHFWFRPSQTMIVISNKKFVGCLCLALNSSAMVKREISGNFKSGELTNNYFELYFH